MTLGRSSINAMPQISLVVSLQPEPEIAQSQHTGSARLISKLLPAAVTRVRTENVRRGLVLDRSHRREGGRA